MQKKRNAKKKRKEYKCFPLIILVYVSRINKYYLQTFLEVCKYKMKKYKTECNIGFNFDTSSSDESDNEPDSESDSEFDNNESGNNKSNNKSLLMNLILNLKSLLRNLIVKLINLLMNLKIKTLF